MTSVLETVHGRGLGRALAVFWMRVKAGRSAALVLVYVGVRMFVQSVSKAQHFDNFWDGWLRAFFWL
jgi:hypothetical protein